MITRADLPIGMQAVQAMHAAIEWVFSYPKLAENWHNISNYIILLKVNNEKELFLLLEKAKILNVLVSAFFEPDLNNQLTAVALEPHKISKEFCKKFKLVGS